MLIGRSIATAIGTHNGLTTGVHGVGAQYVAVAVGSQYEAINVAGDVRLGRDFRRNSLASYLALNGGLDFSSQLVLYGQDNVTFPGGFLFSVPNTAKDDYVIAMRFTGATDTPEMAVGRVPRARIPDFAHGATHVNGQPDEFSVAGLSGLLADDQNPVAHGPGEHLNRNRELPLIPFLSGSGVMGLRGEFYAYSLDANGEWCVASFLIPVGFVSFVSAKIAVVPTTTGTFDWTVSSEQLANGEHTGTDTDTATADGQAATDGTLLELDVTAALNGLTLVVGDWVGVTFHLDVLTTITELDLVGLKVTIEGDE